MNQREADLLDTLRDANPVAVEELRAELGDEGFTDARRHVAQVVAQRRAPVAPSRSRHLRHAALAALGTAILAAVLGWLPAGEDPANSPGPLSAAAVAAAEMPTTVPTAGAYSYLKLRAGSTDDVGGGDTEWWVASDGSGRMVETMTGLGEGETPTGARWRVTPGGRGWRQTGPGSWLNDVRFGPGRFARLYAIEAPGVLELDPKTLPTEPDALEATLRRSLRAAADDSDPETGFHRGPSAEQAEMLIVIGQFLAHPLASPQLRGALYRLAGGLPGVTVREDVEDPVGRRGTALSFTERIGPTTNRHEVIFDPATTETLATRLVSMEPGPPPRGSPCRTKRPKGSPETRAPRARRQRSVEARRREGRRPAMKLSEPPHRGERLVMRRFTQYVVYLARGLVRSPGDRP